MQAAVGKGDVKELAELMRQDPGFKVNGDMDGLGRTLLTMLALKTTNPP